MLAAGASMLEVRALADLDGSKPDTVEAYSGAARDPPDGSLVPKLDATLLKELPTTL